MLFNQMYKERRSKLLMRNNVRVKSVVAAQDKSLGGPQSY